MAERLSSLLDSKLGELIETKTQSLDFEIWIMITKE